MRIYLDNEGEVTKMKAGAEEFLLQILWSILNILGVMSTEDVLRKWLEYPVTYVWPDGRKVEEYIPSYRREYIIKKMLEELEKE